MKGGVGRTRPVAVGDTSRLDPSTEAVGVVDAATGDIGRVGAPLSTIAVDPVVVVLQELVVEILGLEVDGELARVEGDQRQRRRDVDVVLELEATLALQVRPGADDAERGLLGEHGIVVEHELLTAVVVDLILEGSRDLRELRALGDVVDDTTGITLTEEHGSRTADDFHALDVVEVVGKVTEDTVTQNGVYGETTHRERALGSRFVGRTAHCETIVTRGRRGVAEQIGEGVGVGVVEELAGLH